MKKKIGTTDFLHIIKLACPYRNLVKAEISKLNCEGYAEDHNILFNGKKSKYLIFGEYKYNPIITVNNEIVPRCDSAIHLGHLLNTKNTRYAMIEHSIIEFNKSFYGFISKFDGCNTTVKSRLFHQYCA